MKICGIPYENTSRIGTAQSLHYGKCTLKEHNTCTPYLKDLQWLPVKERITFIKFLFSCINELPVWHQADYRLSGVVKNLPLLRRAGNNGRPWVHTVMCGNTYSDICMMIHASTL